MRYFLFTILLLLFQIVSVQQAEAQSLYQNSKYKNWTTDFSTGEYEKVLKAVEEDLKSADPHPLAANAWYELMSRKFRMEEISDQINPAFSSAVSELVNIRVQYAHDGDLKLVSEFPIERIKENPLPDYYSYVYLENAADNFSQDQYSYSISKLMLERFGETFLPAWSIYNMADSNQKIFLELQKDIKDGWYDRYPAVKAFLNDVFQFRPGNNLDDIKAVNKFLDVYPDDASAFRFKAKEYEGLEKYNEAKENFVKAFKSEIRDINYTDIAENLVRQYQYDDARSVVIKGVKAYAYQPDTAVSVLSKWASILADAGEKGKARVVLEEGIEKFPEDPQVNFEFGELEMNSSRYAYAISYLQKAFAAKQWKNSYLKELFNALRNANEYSRILELYQRIQQTDVEINEGIYFEVTESMGKMDAVEEGISICQEAVRKFPESSWMLRQLSDLQDKNGDIDDAITSLEKSFQIYKPYSWSSNHYTSLLKKKYSANSARVETELRDLLTNYPWSKDVWDKIAGLKKNTDEKLALWNEAINKNPGRLFPYNAIRNLLWHEERWNDIEEMLLNAEQQVAAGSEDDQVDIYFEKGIFLVGKLRKNQITYEEVEDAIKAFNSYLEKGGYAGAYHQYMEEVYEAMGDKEKAKQARLQAIKHRPGNYSPYWDLATKDELINHFYDLWQRNPYHQQNLKDLIRLNALWGGSNIAAIYLSKIYKEYFPDKANDIDIFQNMAYQKLGMNAKAYEEIYANASVIGKSDRYIDWYHGYRKESWIGNTTVELDNEKAMITVTLPDGTMYQQQDDIKFGKIKKAIVGDSYISFQYNDNGSLTDILSSAGVKISLIYNENNKITDMINGDEHLSFTYNELGKPVIIKVDNIGTLTVTYDENGGVLSTSAVDDKGEPAAGTISSRIIQNMNDLTSTIRTVGNVSSLSSGKLPDLGFVDERHQELYSKYSANSESYYFEEQTGREEFLSSAIELTRYDIEHTHVNAEYVSEAYNTLLEIIHVVKEAEDKKLKTYGLQGAELFYKLLQKTRKSGVSAEYWEEWVAVQEWLYLEQQRDSKRDKKYIRSINSFIKKINSEPVVLLSSSEWLPKSWLNTEALWKEHNFSEVLPKAIAGVAKPTALLYRKNGEILLGTSHGLCVLRKGFWEWFAYDIFSGNLSKDVNIARLSGLSIVNALHEDENGKLFIGTADGLIILEGGYTEGKIKKFNELDGLPGRAVNAIGILGEKVLIGGSKGNAWITDNSITTATDFNNEELRFISSSSSILVVGSNKNTYSLQYDEQNTLKNSVIAKEAVDDAIMIEDPNGENIIYTLKGQEVFKVIWDDEISGWKEINLLGNIVTTDANQVYGLTSIPVNDQSRALGVLTDYGISIFNNKYFQHFTLPLSVGEVYQAKKASAYASKFGVITQNGIITFQQNESEIALEDQITDLLYVQELSMTFIADGGALKMVRDGDPSDKIETIGDYYSSTKLIYADSKSRILVNDGLSIFRYTYDEEVEDFFVEELFYCHQTEPESQSYTAGDVNSIIEAQDGTIWVSTGLAVFRYVENEETEPIVNEYNFFRNPEAFPSRTHMVSNLIQTLDGNIYVVGSNERHLSYRGTVLEGGFLKWDEDNEVFIRLSTNDYNKMGFNWFITSYTQIDKNKAIFGTLSGFGEDNFGDLRNYGERTSELKNSTYASLKEKHPNLFLGTKGAKFGDIWLFGSAAGVVAYYDGLWFYPERLNQLLPDDVEFRNYGSRHVNAISINKDGEIFVGTDRGLLRYYSPDNDASDLLLRNTDTQAAIVYHNVRQLEKESNDVLNTIPGDSEAGKILAEINEVKAVQERLSISKAEARNEQLKSESTIRAKKIQNVDSLVRLIENSSARYTELMLRLRQQEPGIWQLLALPPLDLKANAKKLKDNECIIQYIPMSKKLFIHIINNKEVKIKEVDIERQLLMDTTVFVAQQMASKGRGTVVTTTKEKVNTDVNVLDGTLRFLFDVLLEPVYDDIADFENIIVVPTGELNYLPFATLSYGDKKLRYAVQDHNFGYVSTLYLFDLMYNIDTYVDPSKSVFFADPDFTLPGAKQEGELLASLTNSTRLFTGNNASYKNMLANLVDANIIHLATHGFLNEKAIEKSWIRFSDKDITMANIYDLPLTHTNMMVLSACETALGAQGMEYAHLARAFANAGVPSIIASLWAVDDNATKELIVNFYKNLIKNGNKFWALSEAQRQLISSDDKKLNHPSMWGGFISIGKAD